MLKTTAFANAAAVLTGTIYIVCLVLSWITPDLLISLSNSWVHALNLEAIRDNEQIGLGTVVWGFITSAVLTWIAAYGFAYFYNKFAK